MRAICYHCPTWRFVVCRALGPVWPGVYFSALAPVRLRDVAPLRELPRGWARVRVHQCGLCASDLHLLRLRVSPMVAPSAVLGGPRHRCVLGHEIVGTVTAVGPGASVPVGQRVISRSGSFRNCYNACASPDVSDLCPACAQGEYALCERQGDAAPRHELVRGGGYGAEYCEHAANLLPVPGALSDDEALLAEPLATGLRAALRVIPVLPTGTPRADTANHRLGRALVIGAGIQGLGTIHWLHQLEPRLELTCLVRYPHQAELARTLGADQVLPAGTSTCELAARLGSSVARGVGRNELLVRGFDTTIDTIATPRTLHDALRRTRAGGLVLVVGAHLHPGLIDYSPIWFRDVTLRGVYAHGRESFRGRSVSTLALTLELLVGDARLPTNLVTHHLPLSAYRQAVALMTNKAPARTVRVALRPDSGAYL